MNAEVIKGNNRIYARRKGGNAKGKLRVAAYCRVSTNDEDQLNSYRSQVTYYTELIKRKTIGCLPESMPMRALRVRRLPSARNSKDSSTIA